MNPTTANSRITRKLATAAAMFGLWVALVLLFAAPLAFTGPISLRQALTFGASFWALWLLFLPAVTWLSFRFPIEQKNLLRNAALHLLACLLIVGASKTTYRALDDILHRSRRSEWSQQSPGSRPGMPSPPGSFRPFLALRAGLDVLVYWSLVGACQAIMQFHRSQERERRAAALEASLTNAKLQALRMQINPHFLFNTLNSISALLYLNPRAADEMLGNLSQLLRRSLDSMEEQEIPLVEELEFVDAYLNIEQKRFGERLRFERTVPDELMKALVPALILQPLVENAIRHGIEPQRAPGLISIQAKKEKNQLHLVVRDNGQGLPSAAVNTSARRGIGLANTRARLQALYAQDQDFSFSKAQPQGSQVDIRLPLHFQPHPTTNS